MKKITLICGSTQGEAECLAEHLDEILKQKGFITELTHSAALNEITHEGLWLIVTSTHGAGDLPDNLSPFFDQIEKQCPNLSKVNYGAIGLGSKAYDTFCGAIQKADRILQKHNANRIGDRLEIDMIEHETPDDPAVFWLNHWITLLTNE